MPPASVSVASERGEQTCQTHVF